MKNELVLFALLSFSSSVFAENWAQWRGPFHNGSTTETNLPTKWSQTENIAWVADLPGASAATPIVWEENVFVSSGDKENDQLFAICIDRKSGQERWRHKIADGLRRDSRSTYAAPSPATDGKTVVFFYGNGKLIAYDFDGNEKWKRDIQEDYGEFAFQWTFSTSPIIHNSSLYLQVLQRDTAVRGRGFADKENESYILSLNPETGDTKWQHKRPCEAVAESREAFTTPIISTLNGREQLVIAGGDDLTGHDLNDGSELWRWGTWNPTRIAHWRLVPSPVVGDDIVLACAPKRDPIYAIRAGEGRLNDDHIAWVSRDIREVSSDVPTPAFYDGDFFVLSDVRKSISRVEPKSGEVKWTVRTPGSAKFEASPLAADGKIYVMNFVGDVVIFDASNGEIINNISMDEPADDAVRSSIIASQGQLFIRTNGKLFCVGK